MRGYQLRTGIRFVFRRPAACRSTHRLQDRRRFQKSCSVHQWSCFCCRKYDRALYLHGPCARVHSAHWGASSTGVGRNSRRCGKLRSLRSQVTHAVVCFLVRLARGGSSGVSWAICDSIKARSSSPTRPGGLVDLCLARLAFCSFSRRSVISSL